MRNPASSSSCSEKSHHPHTKYTKSKSHANGVKLRKGLWSPEEDEKLMQHMLSNGQGCWSEVARNAGLHRCGKSCRLHWINYMCPDLKRGAFSLQEQDLIVQWSQIAARLPRRTDNEIKNFWNSTIKKRRMRNRNPNLEGRDQQATMVVASTSCDMESSMATRFINSIPSSASLVDPTLVDIDLPALASDYLSPSLSSFPSHVVDQSGELFVPCLQSYSLIGQENAQSYPLLGNNQFNCLSTVGIPNNWEGGGDETRFGEWDFEQLLKDASSFPFLDFQVD